MVNECCDKDPAWALKLLTCATMTLESGMLEELWLGSRQVAMQRAGCVPPPRLMRGVGVVPVAAVQLAPKSLCCGAEVRSVLPAATYSATSVMSCYGDLRN